MSSQVLNLYVFRVGSSDPDQESPEAWEAHRGRARFLREVLDDDGWTVSFDERVNDEERTHEGVGAVIDFVMEVAASDVARGPLLYAGHTVLNAIEDVLKAPVKRLIHKLTLGIFEGEVESASISGLLSDASIRIESRNGELVLTTTESHRIDREQI